MKEKAIGNTVVLRLEIGEDIVKSVKDVCARRKITAAHISGIGALKKAVVGVFNMETKVYKSNEYNEFTELTNLCGNASLMNGETYIHLHATLADEEGHAFGGHLNEGIVGATAEIFITVLDGVIDRVYCDETGLNVFDI